MKSFSRLALVAALLTLGSLSSLAAGKPAPAPETPPPPPPKSTFTIDPKFGRDPFFPSSVRLVKLAPQITNSVETPPPPPLFPEELRLMGFSALASKRLCIVNGRTVETGEKFTVRLAGGQAFTVVCVEIRNRSVVLEVNGLTKELHLSDKLK